MFELMLRLLAVILRNCGFMDAEGSGLMHRSAWAGTATGVLFYAPLNEGAIVRNDQYIFTEWGETRRTHSGKSCQWHDLSLERTETSARGRRWDKAMNGNRRRSICLVA